MFQVGKLLPRKLIAKQWVKNNDCCVKSNLGKRNEVKLPQTILMIEMTKKNYPATKALDRKLQWENCCNTSNRNGEIMAHNVEKKIKHRHRRQDVFPLFNDP